MSDKIDFSHEDLLNLTDWYVEASRTLSAMPEVMTRGVLFSWEDTYNKVKALADQLEAPKTKE